MSNLGDLPLGHPLHTKLQSVTKDTKITPWTIENGKPKKLKGSILIHPAQKTIISGPHTLTFLQIDNITLCIDTMAKAPTTYASITTNTLFRQFYRVAAHPILYASGTVNMESMTCVYCGIILPQQYMQMDHQRPQVGGHHEAVAKTLRTLRLTRGGPKGEKCRQLVSYLADAMAHRQGTAAGLTLLFASGAARRANPVTPRSMRNQVPAGNVKDRYSLNDLGTVLYSLIVHFGLEERLQRQCMHTLSNLRPLCGPCNGRRGNNVLKF